jgi:hypothetical protein
MRLSLLLATTALLVASVAQASDPGAILDANRAASGGAAWDSKAALSLRYAYSGIGLTGVVQTRYDLDGAGFADSFDLGSTSGANGFDGQSAWMQDQSGAVTPQAGGDTRQLAVNEAYRDGNLWWRADRGGAAIRDLGPRTEDGAIYDVLSVTPSGGKAFEAWFDSTSHLLARTVEPQGSQTNTVFYSDYRGIDGALVPGKLVIDDGSGAQYRQTQTLSDAKFIAAEPSSAFAAPHVALRDAQIDNPTGVTTVPFRLLNNHIYAEVKVNGKGRSFASSTPAATTS